MLKFKLSLLFIITMFLFSSYETATSYERYMVFMKTKPTVCDYNYNLVNSHVRHFIMNASNKTGLPMGLIDAMITVESSGKANSISPTKVKGYMQVTIQVAKKYKLNRDNPRENILAGSLYLKDMIDKFGSLDKGLMAYTLGPGGALMCDFKCGKWYVNRVMGYYNKFYDR